MATYPIKNGPILVTGVAGFIGFHLAQHLSGAGHEVVGIDNISEYYEIDLKLARLAELKRTSQITFEQLDLRDRDSMLHLFKNINPRIVINLAAQAGVRYSLTHPHSYIDTNITGFLNLLECCRCHPVDHLLYASSSSVYGSNTKVPFAVGDDVSQPINLYAASKRSNELMAYVYSHLFGIPSTGLRFFTVYGPWGRPDMAPFIFTRAILDGRPIQLFGFGKMKRDFTYIDDIIDGVSRLINLRLYSEKTILSDSPFQLYNIGNSTPITVNYFVDVLEKALGRRAIRETLPAQPGEVQETWADIEPIRHACGFEPLTSIEDGIPKFTSWFTSFYDIKS